MRRSLLLLVLLTASARAAVIAPGAALSAAGQVSVVAVPVSEALSPALELPAGAPVDMVLPAGLQSGSDLTPSLLSAPASPAEVSLKLPAARFLRDPAGAVVQASLDPETGRVQNTLPNAANESISFTARDAAGAPAPASWSEDGAAEAMSLGSLRGIRYELRFDQSEVTLGHVLLGSVMEERQVVDQRRHLQPFDDLVPASADEAFKALLKGNGIPGLDGRIGHVMSPPRLEGGRWTAVVIRQAPDGASRLALEVGVDASRAVLETRGGVLTARSLDGRPVRLAVAAATDSPPLTRMSRAEIFRPDFLTRVEGREDAELPLRAAEILLTREKWLAGLKNYGTYFGRDTLMTALMLADILSADALEAAISVVLEKLDPAGRVSHEETVGLLAMAINAGLPGEPLRKTRENYVMVDDEFQLPVLIARYLAREDIPASRKRAFFGRRKVREAVLSNLRFIAAAARGYAERPGVSRLIGFPRGGPGRWFAASWRDSGAGYADGRYPMDVNAIWVPKALESAREIMEAFRGFGFRLGLNDPLLAPDWLTRAARVWRRAWRHFAVRAGGMEFRALSLDGRGRPIPVLNTDVAQALFLDELAPEEALALVRPLLEPYPRGLFLEGVGVLVANDAYASAKVRKMYERDPYHSPRVVWGREMNLLQLGLARQILAAYDPDGRLKDPASRPHVRELREALEKVHASGRASGLDHNELWTYRLEDGRPRPERYATTSDLQLWNLGALAVEDALRRVRALP